jgi:anti-sigma factor RsiW
MKDCTTYRPMIGSLDGELSPPEATALATHLAGCAGCRAFQADLAATEGLVAQALEQAAARRDFAPFVDGVMARLATARPPSLLARLTRQLRLHPRLLVGGALVPLLAVALALYVRAGSGSDLADAHDLELHSEGRATTIIQSSDGPVLLLDDDDNGES